MAEKSIRIKGRSSKFVTKEQLTKLLERLFDFQQDRLRRYPEVIGGIVASHTTLDGLSSEVQKFSDLMNLYETGESIDISISGQNELDLNKSAHFYFSLPENVASLDVSSNDVTYISASRSLFESIFPNEPYHNLDYVLLQRGFSYTAKKSKLLPNYRKFLTRASRQKLKSQIGAQKYGSFFEHYCETVAYYELRWSTLLNVKIIGEGVGGDYDVLALAETTKEMIYLEAKTGDVDLGDFEQFAKRHVVLQPSISIIILDHSSAAIVRKLPDIQKALKKVFAFSTEPVAMPLPTLRKGLAYSLGAGIFIICGDDIIKSIKHCVRYYDGVAKRSA